MKKVKTVFVQAKTQSQSIFSRKRYQIDGVQSTNDIQAVIEEMEIDDYELSHVQTSPVLFIKQPLPKAPCYISN